VFKGVYMGEPELKPSYKAYTCVITPEEYELIKNREMEIYIVDGRTIFETSDGQYVFYVIFK
jgi:hypothetical protein